MHQPEGIENLHINLCNIKTISSNFGQNTAEFYDDHICLITKLCTFWQEFGLKQCYFELLLMENKFFFFKHHSPPPLDTKSPSHI